MTYDKGNFVFLKSNFAIFDSFRFREELDDLSVKQLKEVLMLNRVDFKGCCEKSELLERVQRLWDDLQNCPGKRTSDSHCLLHIEMII